MVTVNNINTTGISIQNTPSTRIQNNKITSIFESNTNTSKNKEEKKGLSLATKIIIGSALTAGALIMADYFLYKGTH